MSQNRTLTCIRCPRGCAITVTLEAGEVRSVSGNSCRRGDTYARAEVANPVRTVTTVVPVTGNPHVPTVSVKTAGDVPKGAVMDVMRALAQVTLASPVRIGDVVLADVAGTGVDVVATRRA